VLDREVDFPLAGYVGPGFHTWPSGHIPQDTAPNPLLRSRPTAKKDVRRGVRRRDRGQRPTATEIPIRNNNAGGQAATVAGYAGPGFHTWPSGHIPQDTAPNPLLRSRPTAKKTFGEALGEATGVGDPRLQKIRIRNNGAGGQAATDRGRDGALDCPTPPSEPDGRISRIRLTS
jgi:hypothetical protein